MSTERNIILSEKKDYSPKAVPVIKERIDKIRLTDDQTKKFDYLVNNGPITIDEVSLQLRGGDGLTDVLGIISFVIFMNWYDSLFGSAEAFQANPLPHRDLPGWVNGEHGYKNIGPSGSRFTSSAVAMEKPSEMTQAEYSAMPKEEKRRLPDPLGRDRCIEIEGCPRLDVPYNQVKYKLPRHGKDHNLPVKNNGKTAKTEANAIAFRDSIVDMPKRKNIVFYTNGQYQEGNSSGYKSINLFDPDSNVIAV